MMVPFVAWTLAEHVGRVEEYDWVSQRGGVRTKKPTMQARG